jgi:Tol biopolymer transport system component
VLAFVRDGTLLGQAYDWKKGTLKGEPFAVADGVRYFLSTFATAMAMSDGGTLAYHQAADQQRLVWLDRAGREVGDAISRGSFLHTSISPDGKRALMTRQQLRLGTWDIWMMDLERGIETPLTTSPNTEINGLWLADQTIIYSVSVGGPPVLVRRDLDSTVETRLLDEPHFQVATDLSPDRRTLMYRRRPAIGTWDIWALLLDGTAEPAPLLETPFNEIDARFSPDGRYVAVLSDETGQQELYVTPFPGPGQKTRVSANGAEFVNWPRESGELIYVTGDGRMVALPVQTQPTLHIGTPVTLFSLDRPRFTTIEATSDGERFLVAIPTTTASRQPITVVTNWAGLGGR